MTRKPWRSTAGGHTFGKAHGAGDPDPWSAQSRKPPRLRKWASGLDVNEFGSGKGDDTTTSGIEGAWTANANHSGTMTYFDLLFRL